MYKCPFEIVSKVSLFGGVLSYFLGGDFMGKVCSRKNRRWTKEDRIRVVKRYLDEHIGTGTLAKIENVPRGTLRKWITKYLKSGEEALESKKKVGNRFSALHTSKSLTLEERQRLIIEKQQIEIYC